jgi:hypothetical protein
LTNRDPSRAAPHLAYELGMLRSTFASLPAHGPIPVVALEGFLLHSRNLIEFFWDCAPKGAILPKDFGAPRRRDKDPTIAKLHDEISQLVSHLTWARVEVHELSPNDWSHQRLTKIWKDIGDKARAFFHAISSEQCRAFSAAPFPEEYRNWIGNG